MKTKVLLNEMGLEALASKALAEGLEGATAFLEVWRLKEIPSRGAEEQGQLVELITALGQEEAVEKSIVEDLASMGEWAWEEDFEAFVESARHFAWLADLLLRIDRAPNLTLLGDLVDSVSGSFGDWQASNHLDRVWGDVVVWHLRRQTSVTWELVEEDGKWVVREVASGLSFGIWEGPLPAYAGAMSWAVERRLGCKFYADAYAERPQPEIEVLFRSVSATLGETLMKEGLALAGLKGFDPQDEGLYELWCQLEKVNCATPPGRSRLAIREACNRVMDAWCDQAEG